MGDNNIQQFNHDVFISYSNENKQIADAIVADLEQHGIKCWYAPRDIVPGKSWTESARDAIKNCQIMIPICTADPASSQQVSGEITLAASEGKTIEPFPLSSDDINNAILNTPAGVHWIDAITQPLSMRIIDLREKIRPMIAAPDDAHAPINLQSISPPDDNTTSSVNQTFNQRQIIQSWVYRNNAALVVVFFICAIVLLLIRIRQSEQNNLQQVAVTSDPAQETQTSETFHADEPAQSDETFEDDGDGTVQTDEEVSSGTSTTSHPITVSMIDSGSAGESAKWHMFNNGLLEISGKGKMNDCEWDIDAQKAIQPWDVYRDMITNVVIEDGINYIGECSFRQCSHITSIEIPKSVTSIGWCAFEDCAGLREFAVSPDNPGFCSVEGVLFNKSMTSLLTYPAAKPGT